MEREARKGNAANAQARAGQNAAAMLQVAEGLRLRGKLEEAQNMCLQILEDHPKLPQAHIAVGTILEQRERRDEAYQHFKEGVTLAPQDFAAWHRFGKCLYTLKHFDAALIAFKKATGLRPASLDALLFLGRTLHHLERSDEALTVFELAADQHPKEAAAHLEKGLQQQTTGDFSGARMTLECAIQLDPKMVEAHFRLAAMGETIDEQERSIVELKKLSEDAALAPDKRAAALFAAARVVHKQKRGKDAFELYRRANDALKEMARFDRTGLSTFVDITSHAFVPEVFDILADAGDDTATPIFIVGMPRSGTTLVEQIVSSHPDVCAGGEERKMSELTEALMREDSGKLRYPADAQRIDPQMLKPVGRSYSEHMRRRFPNAMHITDKNPFNFFHIGLISVLFPKATIIHCQREPMDTCLSCYFQYFGDIKSLAFTVDLEDLGHFYNTYLRMMAHWEAVLPGRILSVQYEDLITDQEGLSRTIIDRVGLEWDDACLRFNENERSVRTASQWQVRQPIYNSSVGRWREFESELAPLREVLGHAA
jgi:tetratricopeptide (TPR) repeat protein